MTEDELIQSLSAVAADQRDFANILDRLSETAPTPESQRDFQSRAAEARCEAEQFEKFAQQIKERGPHMPPALR